MVTGLSATDNTGNGVGIIAMTNRDNRSVNPLVRASLSMTLDHTAQYLEALYEFAGESGSSLSVCEQIITAADACRCALDHESCKSINRGFNPLVKRDAARTAKRVGRSLESLHRLMVSAGHELALRDQVLIASDALLVASVRFHSERVMPIRPSVTLVDNLVFG